jgi:hypothetical protein
MQLAENGQPTTLRQPSVKGKNGWPKIDQHNWLIMPSQTLFAEENWSANHAKSAGAYARTLITMITQSN